MGSKKLLSGIFFSLSLFFFFFYENNFLEEQADFHCNNNSVYKTKQNSKWSKALSIDHREFCLVIYLTMGGNKALICPQVHVSDLLLPFIPGSKYLLLAKKLISYADHNNYIFSKFSILYGT